MADISGHDISSARKPRVNTEAARASRRKWYLKNKDREFARAKRWRANNPEKARAMFRAQYLKNYKGKGRRRRLTPELFDQMLASQGACCAICRVDQPRTKKGWLIDHDHATGFVRGILCQGCNLMLGHARDNPQTLRAGIEYLATHSSAP